ncbi:MAG: hypothetical protein K8S21_02035 [Gemmatimonadetes bacterium]|nr:hypothetical protein [Gemmatimonadota bacterium]
MRLPLAALALAFAVPAAAHAQAVGSYLALRIDESPLPLADRVTDTDGTTYLVEFERMVLSLRSGNKFRAAVRFKRSLSTSDSRAGSRTAPIQSMTVTGRYEVTGKEIRFIADSTSDTRGVRMLNGTIDGAQRLSLPFDYRNGAVQRRRVLRLQFRNDIL